MLRNNSLINIGNLLKVGKNSLLPYSNTPELDCEVILSSILKVKKEFLITHQEDLIELPYIKSFKKSIIERKKGIPVAYITKYKEFYGLNFNVGKGVLIPRPETEQIIEISNEIIKKKLVSKKRVKVFEIGTGSGCISIVLKNIFGIKINMKAYEISKKAYKYAIQNYKELKPGKINIINKDAFTLQNSKNKYDLIISNPPYLTQKDMESIKIEVKKEPRKALFGGKTGLEYYFKLKIFLLDNLSKNGVAVFEINEKLGKKTAAIFSDKYNCRIIKDYFGKDRFLIISPQQ